MKCDGNDPITMDPSDECTKKSEFKIMISFYFFCFVVVVLVGAIVPIFGLSFAYSSLFFLHFLLMRLTPKHDEEYRNIACIENCIEKNEEFSIIFIFVFVVYYS